MMNKPNLKASYASALLLPLIAGTGSCTGQVSKRPEHPNILVIITDQQSASMMSCAGNRWLKTPALDAIAAQGVRFTCAYATNPVCIPSRFSLQTGHYPSEINLMDNNTAPVNKEKVKSMYPKSLGNLFRNAGYQTYYGGKVHLPVTNMKIGPWGYDVLTYNERDSLATVCADFLLHRKKSDKPFLLISSFINPHDICYDAIRWATPESELAKGTPWEVDEALKIPKGISKEEFFAKYCPPLPANHAPMIGETSGVDSLLKLRTFRGIVREKWTDEDWRMHRWAYARLTERVDAQIGIVIEALRKSGLAENTIVIFTSDHGDLDAAHKLEHKTFFYQESINIPFLISYPWMKQKGVVDTTHLINNGLDLLPTLCDFAGIKAPSDITGKSVVPLTKQEASINWRKHIFLETEIGFLIHTGHYKYELDGIGKNREMFVDLKSDPGETINMIDNPKYKDESERLRGLLMSNLKDKGIQIKPAERR
jgi:arylsulfatase A-like enzyme